MKRKTKGPNWGILDEERFKWMEKEKIKYLRGLTIEKSVEIFESLTSPEMVNEFKDQPLMDTPVCLKIALRKQKK
jgi:hypothetical protein